MCLRLSTPLRLALCLPACVPLYPLPPFPPCRPFCFSLCVSHFVPRFASGCHFVALCLKLCLELCLPLYILLCFKLFSILCLRLCRPLCLSTQRSKFVAQTWTLVGNARPLNLEPSVLLLGCRAGICHQVFEVVAAFCTGLHTHTHTLPGTTTAGPDAKFPSVPKGWKGTIALGCFGPPTVFSFETEGI